MIWWGPTQQMWFHWAGDQFGGVPIWRGKKLGHENIHKSNNCNSFKLFSNFHFDCVNF